MSTLNKIPEAQTATGIQFSEETITPNIAREWLLNHNDKNRVIKRRHVEALAREMHQGRWEVNGESIMFSVSGRLINGQHRLEAVILSNTTIRSAIQRNVSDNAYKTLDQGSKRKAADDLGVLGVMNASKVASTAKIVCTWNTNLPVRSSNVTKTEISEFVAANPSLAEIVSYVNGKKPPLPVSAVAAVGWMATRTPAYQAQFEEFVDRLHTGIDLPEAHPILALRTLAFSLRKGHIIQGDVWFALVATCWNDFIKGNTRRAFRTATHQWPNEVIGYGFRRDTKNVKTPFVFTGPTRKPEEPSIIT